MPTDTADDLQRADHDPGSRDMALKVVEMINGSWTTQAISVAARLGIPDLLANGPKSGQEIAAAANAYPHSLQRLLRALVTLEILSEGQDGSYTLTPTGQVLRSDAAASVRSWATYCGQYQWPLWEHLLGSIQTGQSARALLAGTKGFEHLERDPEIAAVFNQAMLELTRLIAENVVRAYDFSKVERIADIGGGCGELLRVILQANPQVRGVLFDMAHAVEKGRSYLGSFCLADRCEFVTGSFFEAVPSGADAYVLKNIIHDWNDKDSAIILAACRRAVTERSKLLLVEQVMPERLEASPAHRSVAGGDLNMLVGLGAKERTAAEFDMLLTAAGFRMTGIIPATPVFHMIEAVAA